MDQISELFATVARWATLKGAVDLKAQPGLWEDRLGEFNIAINAHAGETLKSQDGLSVPPFHIVINAPDYLGAVMLVAPDGGVGAAGMEDDVLAALEADIARIEGAPA